MTTTNDDQWDEWLVSTRDKITMARQLPPEDIQPGDYVTVLYIVDEHLPLSALTDAAWRRVEPVRVLWLPWCAPAPLKVLDVCLPFVLVRDQDGDPQMLDTRRLRLARVAKRFVRASKRCARKAKQRCKRGRRRAAAEP